MIALVEGAPLLPTPVNIEQESLIISATTKLNLRVTPLCWFILLFAYIDRGNLGFAASRVCDALHLTNTEYGIGASLFFVGYLLSQIPSNVLIKKVGPPRWFSVLLIFWGAVATSLAFVQTDWQFYIARFLLGVAEGGCFPGVWYYLACLFPNEWLALPLAAVDTSIVIAQVVSAPIAAGLLALDGLFGIDGWRLLFFVEGLIPVLYGACLPWALPSTVQEASFLTDEEKSSLLGKLKAEAHNVVIPFWDQLKIVVTDKRTWWIIISGIFRFGTETVALYFTALIIDDMLNGDDDNDDDDDDEDSCGSTDSNGLAAILLTAIPYSLAAIASLLVGYLAQTVKNRSKAVVTITCAAAPFFLLWVFVRNASFIAAFASISFGIMLNFAPMCLILSILLSVNTSETKALSLSFMNTAASLGGVFSPLLLGFLIDHYGYGVGISVLSILPLLSGVCFLFVEDPLKGT